MSKKNKILICLLFILILFVILISLVVIFKKEDNYLSAEELDNLTKIFEINSYYFDYEFDLSSEIDISMFDDLTLNKLFSSYVITYVVPSSSYDACIKCYKYFSSDDNIKFYDKDIIENNYLYVFNKNIEKITQDDIIDFNILYYNEEIDMYYINISYKNTLPKVISKFKEYRYINNKLYLSYYYVRIDYDEVNKKIWFINSLDNYDNLFDYDEIFNDNMQIKDNNLFDEYFDIINYEFIYDKESKKYVLNKINVKNI